MIKKVRLALLGISFAIGSSAGASADMFLETTDQAGEPSTRLAAFTRDDLRQIRDCVDNRDILCLRSILVANPDLMQGDTKVSQALVKFMSVTDSTSAQDLFTEIKPAIEQASAIYS